MLFRSHQNYALTEMLNAIIARNFDVTERWISDAELDANPGLVKTMSVQPPRGAGRIRLVRIGDLSEQVDLQHCGGEISIPPSSC